MTNHYITYITLSLLFALLSACSNNDLDTANVQGMDDTPGAFMERDAFYAGDEVTRSTLVYGQNGLEFKWALNDQIGMYTTAMIPPLDKDGKPKYDGLIIPENQVNPEEQNHNNVTPQNSKSLTRATISENESKNHPMEGFYYTDPTKTQQACYTCVELKNNGLYARIDAQGDNSFNWSVNHGDSIRWTVYTPYNGDFDPANDTYYNALPFDFTNQTQKGFVNMKEFYTNGYFNNETYKQSEEAASAHLGKADFLISAETKFAKQTVFHLRHIGAVARFFLLAPTKDLTLVSLRLICDKKIFYPKGKVDLTSRTYVADVTKGLCLIGDTGTPQMTPDETSLTNSLELKFDGVKIDYTKDTRYGNYLIAYLMMYPITYNSATDGNLFAYVTATDTDGKELHFVSNALANKTMKSGCYYQWTSATHEDDGLYPIELTATLLPWQDIVGGGIETDLTK